MLRPLFTILYCASPIGRTPTQIGAMGNRNRWDARSVIMENCEPWSTKARSRINSPLIFGMSTKAVVRSTQFALALIKWLAAKLTVWLAFEDDVASLFLAFDCDCAFLLGAAEFGICNKVWWRSPHVKHALSLRHGWAAGWPKQLRQMAFSFTNEFRSGGEYCKKLKHLRKMWGPLQSEHEIFFADTWNDVLFSSIETFVAHVIRRFSWRCTLRYALWRMRINDL